MMNFKFFNPTKVIFGKNVVDNIGKEAKKLGKKALLVYGLGSIKKTGLYEKIVSILKEHDIEIIEHSGVKPNPVLSHTREGVKKAKENNVDMIIAVGGGSVIDEAKAIAAGAVSECDVWDFFELKEIVRKALPIITVLTIAGTGSEMNSGLVITNEEKKAKYGFRADALYPKVSFLDPQITFTVPKDHTAYGAVDAFSHVSEVYLNRFDHSDVSLGIMESIMKSIVKASKIAVENPTDYNARAELMWCSSLALCGITWCGVAPGVILPAHMIEHSLSAIYDIAHGAGLAIVIPGWMKYMVKNNLKIDEISQFGERVFGVKDPEGAITAFEKWVKEIGCPIKLEEANIPEKDIGTIAENAYELSKLWGMSEFYTKEVIEDILKLCV